MRWIPKLDNLRFKNRMKEKLGEEEYRHRAQLALSDPEVAAIPALVDALGDPDKGRNAWIVELLPFPSVASALAMIRGNCIGTFCLRRQHYDLMNRRVGDLRFRRRAR